MVYPSAGGDVEDAGQVRLERRPRWKRPAASVGDTGVMVNVVTLPLSRSSSRSTAAGSTGRSRQRGPRCCPVCPSWTAGICMEEVPLFRKVIVSFSTTNPKLVHRCTGA